VEVRSTIGNPSSVAVFDSLPVETLGTSSPIPRIVEFPFSDESLKTPLLAVIPSDDKLSSIKHYVSGESSSDLATMSENSSTIVKESDLVPNPRLVEAKGYSTLSPNVGASMPIDTSGLSHAVPSSIPSDTTLLKNPANIESSLPTNFGATANPLLVNNPPHTSATLPWAKKFKASLLNLKQMSSPTFLDDGTPVVVAPPSVLLKTAEMWKGHLIAQFQGLCPPASNIFNDINPIRGIYGAITVHIISETTSLIYILSLATREWVVDVGSLYSVPLVSRRPSRTRRITNGSYLGNSQERPSVVVFT